MAHGRFRTRSRPHRDSNGKRGGGGSISLLERWEEFTRVGLGGHTARFLTQLTVNVNVVSLEFVNCRLLLLADSRIAGVSIRFASTK